VGLKWDDHNPYQYWYGIIVHWDDYMLLGFDYETGLPAAKTTFIAPESRYYYVQV